MASFVPVATKYPSFRLYHSSPVAGSFSTLAAGYVKAFRELGVVHECLNITTPPDEDGFDSRGWNHDVGLCLGQPSHLHLMNMHASHMERLFMLAPNGRGVPQAVIEVCRKYKVTPVSPSRWGAYVVAEAFDVDTVSVAPHGVDVVDPFPMEKSSVLVRMPLDGEKLAMLHVTSTASDRKGTVSLLEELKELREDIGPFRLTIKCDRMIEHAIRGLVEERGFDVGDVEVDAREIPNNGAWANYLKSHHAVIQPSRSEGFGLVPLEAASVGVPVIMTDCTGHMDHASDIGGPFVDWDSKEEMIPGEDFPVHPLMKASIAGCILAMRWHYPSVAEKYLDNRAKILDKWSWTAVVKRWLDERYGR